MSYLRLSGPPESSKEIAAAAELAKANAMKGHYRGGTPGVQPSYGPGTTSFKQDTGIASMIEVVGNLGIMAWQFMRGKKRAKRRSKRIKLQEQTKNEVTNILNKIYNTGMELVSEGYNPTTAKFEQKLYDLLFQKIGYRGNCNAIVWVPKTKPGKDRPIWFKIENYGRTLTPVTLQGAPPNLQSYWYSRCAGAKTDWMREYQNLLISVSRSELLSTQEGHQKKASLIIGGGLFGMVAIFGITILMLALRPE